MLARSGAVNKVVALTASSQAYSDNDVIGVPTEITNAMLSKASTGTLFSLSAIDKISQNKAIDLIFFDQLPTTMGADGAAYALSDAESAYVLGHVSIAATDWDTSSACSEATKAGIGLGLKSAASTSIWVLAVAREAVTFTGDNLTVRVHIGQD
jgi:hypothetical protein